MTRLIDADALNAEMYRKSFEVDDGRNVWNSGLWIRYKIFEEAIRDAPTIDAVPRWIPVSERLPEIKEHHVSDVCLVYCDNGAMAFSEMQENIFGQWFWECERDDDYHEPVGEVVAWMPLPETYEEKNDASVM